ncbi:MAG: LamG domain-containing protein [Verrucomicrobiales bacterium]
MKKAFIFASVAITAISLNRPSADAAALSLDGVDDWVEITGGVGVIPSGNSPFTIGAWVNPDVHGDSTMTFWGNQAGNEANGFRLMSGGNVRHYYWGNDNDQSTGDISSDSSGPNGDGWHHLSVTFDGTIDTWYWNGAPLGSPFNTGGTVNVADANHRIGSRLDAEFFDGLIDEISIWGVALDEASIASGWNQPIDLGAPGVDQALIAYYNFENGLADSAPLGGSQDGVANGGASIDQGANAPIPEPSAAILGALATALLLLRRRR